VSKKQDIYRGKLAENYDLKVRLNQHGSPFRLTGGEDLIPTVSGLI
jgi:hypothetical protein